MIKLFSVSLDILEGTLGHFLILINRTALELRVGADAMNHLSFNRPKLRSDFVGGGREVQEAGDIYIYLWIIHVDVWQKLTEL